MHWGVQDALYQAEQAMDDLLQNFPNRVVAGLLNVVIFPTGRHYLAPSDKLDHKVAKILQVPNATRSRIGRGQYLTPSEHNGWFTGRGAGGCDCRRPDSSADL